MQRTVLQAHIFNGSIINFRKHLLLITVHNLLLSLASLTNSVQQSPSWEANSHSVKKLPGFYITWRFITVFTRRIGWVEVYIHSFFDLDTRWKWVVSFTPQPLPPPPKGKSPWYLLDRRLGGPQSRTGRGCEEKNSHSSPGIEPQNPDRPAHSLVATSTELPRLRCDGCGKNNLTRNVVVVRFCVYVCRCYTWAFCCVSHIRHAHVLCGSNLK
jgi:hypothetical protein